MLVNIDAAVKRAKIVGYTCQFFGYFIFILSIIGVIIIGLDESTTNTYLAFFLIYIVLSIYLIIYGRQIVKVSKLYHKYIVILSRDPEKSLYTLANSTKTPIEEIRKNITLMIRLKFFPGAKLDKRNYRIVFPDDLPNINLKPKIDVTEVKPAIKSEKYISVTCKNCGAPGKIMSGTVGECEFCGSPLSY